MNNPIMLRYYDNTSEPIDFEGNIYYVIVYEVVGFYLMP